MCLVIRNGAFHILDNVVIWQSHLLVDWVSTVLLLLFDTVSSPKFNRFTLKNKLTCILEFTVLNCISQNAIRFLICFIFCFSVDFKGYSVLGWWRGH